jgi:hypothetical protein
MNELFEGRIQTEPLPEKTVLNLQVQKRITDRLSFFLQDYQKTRILFINLKPSVALILHFGPILK